MRVAILELPASFGDVEGQLKLAQSVGPLDADLVVLPETALTGYVSEQLDFDLTRFGEQLEHGVERLQTLAKHVRCDVVGPVIEATKEGVFNTTVGVSASGECWLQYRKRHPWYPEVWARPGDLAMPLVRRHGLVLTCAVCFDIHFLAAECESTLRAADVLLFPSAWVEDTPGGNTRLPLAAALAAQFDISIVNANWGRGRPAVSGQGASFVVSHAGEVTSIDTASRQFVLTETVRRCRTHSAT